MALTDKFPMSYHKDDADRIDNEIKIMLFGDEWRSNNRTVAGSFDVKFTIIETPLQCIAVMPMTAGSISIAASIP